MKKLLHAMNKLVFVKKRNENEVFDIESLINEILGDFFLTAEYIRSMSYSLDSPYFAFKLEYMNKRIQNFKKKSYIGAAMWVSAKDIPYGSGFTPLLATRERHRNTTGFNCLGKAIILGMYLQYWEKQNYQVFLGINFGAFSDHGLVIIKIKNNYLLCDTENMKLKKLHGEIREEQGYIWYEKTQKDDFNFNYLVIQDFNLGMINAIIGHFIFLQKKSLNDVPDKDREYMVFQNKKFKLCTIIKRTPWQKIQKEYFKNLNQYREKYREKYLTECLLNDLQRQTNELKRRYDEIILDSFEKVFKSSYTPKKHKDFIESFIPILQTQSNEVIAFLEGRSDSGLNLTGKIHLYLKTLREGISNDKVIKSFAIRRFKQRLNLQEQNSIK